MNTEDDCELAADYGYKCKFCRNIDESPAHVQGRSKIIYHYV